MLPRLAAEHSTHVGGLSQLKLRVILRDIFDRLSCHGMLSDLIPPHWESSYWSLARGMLCHWSSSHQWLSHGRSSHADRQLGFLRAVLLRVP